MIKNEIKSPNIGLSKLDISSNYKGAKERLLEVLAAYITLL